MLNGRREPRRMRYSLESRLRIVRLIERGATTPADVAAACGASRASGYRLWRRYQDEGWQGLADRRSTPRRQPRRLSAEQEAQIVALRRELGAGPEVIAVICGRPVSTVGKCCAVPAAHDCRDPSGSCGHATSVTILVSCCTSTSRSSGASERSASASARTA
jgi:transposase-like protein